ncbi:hypothetical protein EV175_002811 [Coemansia sp. RSA 1933]|nr:hypothetical protein EV175_002811 [Coemansia sp. RSA 1933]
MPKSKQVAQIDAQFSSNGNPVARRPDYFVFEDEPLGDDEDAEIDLSSSYMDDIGFDLEDAELNSDFGKSFDLDMLPDPPPRRLSDYNIGVKDVPIRSPSPRDTAEPNEELVRNNGSSQGQSLSVRNDETDTLSKTHDQPLPPVSATSQAVSATSIQSSAYESAAEFPVTPRPGGLAALVSPMSGRHRTLGLPRNNLMFAKPVITEENANFYIKMLALRSAVPAEELSPQTSPPPPRIENKLQSITTIDEPLDEPRPSEEQVHSRAHQHGIGRPSYRTAAINQKPYYYHTYFHSLAAAAAAAPSPDYAIAGCYAAAYNQPSWFAQARINNGICIRIGTTPIDRRWR